MASLGEQMEVNKVKDGGDIILGGFGRYCDESENGGEIAESGRNEMRWLKEERVRSHKNEGENEEGGERDDKCLNLVKNVKPVQCQYK